MSDDAQHPWVDGLTIGQVFAKTVADYADRDALVFPKLGRRLSWRELSVRVDQAARSLLAMGVNPHEHVAVWAMNVPEWIILQFATARIGAVLVTINPAYRAFELKYALQKSDCVSLFLLAEINYEILAEVCPELVTSRPEQLQTDVFPKLRNVVLIRGEAAPGVWSWNTFVEQGHGIESTVLDEIGEGLIAAEAINIQYTSGTTGFPKAATLSHRNILINAFYTGQCQQMTHEDRICIPVPFYHCFGCVLGTLCAAVFGAAMIIPEERFNATDTLDAIEHERVTVIYGVPTMFIAQLEDITFKGRNLSSLRTGIMAGSPCPIEVMRRVINDMGAGQLTIAYGQTETSPVVTQTRIDDPLELRVKTVGRPIPGIETKIVDPATAEELGANQQGEFCSRGHVVMLGYYNDDEATQATIDPDGWLHSGDLAIRLENGYYKITGRIKDMVIRGGENIYPREIEEFLFTHSDVEQSAVVGVPDAKYGEELCAWVKLKTGAVSHEDNIREFCRASLARFKVPKYIRFVEAFPQTVTGKIQKFKIREAMIEELNLSEQETA